MILAGIAMLLSLSGCKNSHKKEPCTSELDTAVCMLPPRSDVGGGSFDIAEK
jgi:hypothetical protein